MIYPTTWMIWFSAKYPMRSSPCCNRPRSLGPPHLALSGFSTASLVTSGVWHTFLAALVASKDGIWHVLDMFHFTSIGSCGLWELFRSAYFPTISKDRMYFLRCIWHSDSRCDPVAAHLPVRALIEVSKRFSSGPKASQHAVKPQLSGLGNWKKLQKWNCHTIIIEYTTLIICVNTMFQVSLNMCMSTNIHEIYCGDLPSTITGLLMAGSPVGWHIPWLVVESRC